MLLKSKKKLQVQSLFKESYREILKYEKEEDRVEKK